MDYILGMRSGTGGGHDILRPVKKEGRRHKFNFLNYVLDNVLLDV